MIVAHAEQIWCPEGPPEEWADSGGEADGGGETPREPTQGSGGKPDHRSSDSCFAPS